jgi:hypothetical protein
LRILDVDEIKTVPYVPFSHPFVERLIGTIRRECLDRLLFWTAADLELKLLEFQRYYNGHRAPCGAERESAGIDPRRTRRPRESPLVSLATALSWALSHADGGVTYQAGMAPLGNVACQRHIDGVEPGSARVGR